MPDPPSTRRLPALPAPEASYPLILPVLALALIVGSHLLWSSPEYRQRHLLVACGVAVVFGKAILWPYLRGMGWPGVLALGGILLVHAASWVGGVWHGATPLAATGLALQGLVGVFGLAVLSVVFMDPRWRRIGKWTALGVVTLVLCGSFIGYFLFIERYIRLGGYAEHYSTLRMALIWPTRLLTGPLGQIAWDHTNYAAYFFALAYLLILEYLAGRPVGRRRVWWLLCGFLGAGVFLTGSRSGWLMLGLGLPLVLSGRSPRFALKALVLLALAVGGGFVGLKAKIAMLPPPPPKQAPPPAPLPPPVAQTPPPPPVVPAPPVKPTPPPPKQPATPTPTVAVHSTGLVNRASAGRTDCYRSIWRELAGTHALGKGLAATGQPVGPLTHEHSTFMATLRGGGLFAVGGHFLILGSAAWAAWRLLRRGRRWPAVLFIGALSGLLFDRSSVITLTGNYEFLTHWVAVAIPLLLAATPRFRADLGSVPANSQFQGDQ